jgi:hypothetical protein
MFMEGQACVIRARIEDENSTSVADSSNEESFTLLMVFAQNNHIRRNIILRLLIFKLSP